MIKQNDVIRKGCHHFVLKWSRDASLKKWKLCQQPSGMQPFLGMGILDRLAKSRAVGRVKHVMLQGNQEICEC